MKRIKLDKIPFMTRDQFRSWTYASNKFSDVTSFLRGLHINVGGANLMSFEYLYDEAYCDHKDLTLKKI